MTSEQHVRNAFLEQARICEKMNSTFMSVLLKGLAAGLDESTLTGKRVLSWEGNPDPTADALALRLAGGLHAIARSGAHTELGCFYSDPLRCVEKQFIPIVLEAIGNSDSTLLDWLDFAPQTNEVARASVIYAGLSAIAKQYQMPLALYEMGCSGGLNLQCASFGYTFNNRKYGSSGSPLQLEPNWSGSLPDSVPVEVISRRGCDLNPLPVEDAANAEKLLSYLWPDQPERISRVEAAIAIARLSPPTLEKAGAGDWVERHFSSTKDTSVVRVLFDTIAWNYFPQEEKQRVEAAMINASSAATPQSPVAWLMFEFDGEQSSQQPLLTLRVWPGDGKRRVLASADPHAASIHWH